MRPPKNKNKKIINRPKMTGIMAKTGRYPTLDNRLVGRSPRSVAMPKCRPKSRRALSLVPPECLERSTRCTRRISRRSETTTWQWRASRSLQCLDHFRGRRVGCNCESCANHQTNESQGSETCLQWNRASQAHHFGARLGLNLDTSACSVPGSQSRHW